MPRDEARGYLRGETGDDNFSPKKNQGGISIIYLVLTVGKKIEGISITSFVLTVGKKNLQEASALLFPLKQYISHVMINTLEFTEFTTFLFASYSKIEVMHVLYGLNST